MKHPILILAALALMLGNVGQVKAGLILGFNALAANQGGGIDAGSIVVESGYQISVLTGRNFSAFADGWQSNRGSSNGTTTLALFNPSNNENPGLAFSLSAVDTSPFTLISIDLGELFHPDDFAFAQVARTVMFTGRLSGGGTVTQNFDLDLISNGRGLPDDFQTVSFSTAWTNLTSVEVSASNPLNPFGTSVNFDNITVAPTTATPEPASLTLLGIGIAGLAGYGWRRRKQAVKAG